MRHSRPHGPVPLDRKVPQGHYIQVISTVPMLMVIDNLGNTYVAHVDGAWVAQNKRAGYVVVHVVTADAESATITVQEWSA